MKNKFYMLLLVSGIGLMSCVEGELQREYTDSVNVFIGTGGHGHTFPGATLPHGMVQLSPDTRLIGWDACSGYYYDDTSIIGFSHTHLSGTGIGDYGDILFMPIVGEKPLVAGTAEKPDEGYRSRFSHDKESARPGYYQVLLQDDSINVELTATLRAGLHRYTYPKGSDARLIIDMEPTIHGHQHPVTQIRVVNDSTIAGKKYTRGWAKQHYVYFYAVFSKSFDYKLYSGTEYQPDSTSVTVNTAKAVITFRNLSADGLVLAKVGISSVDEEGAKLNLESEIPDWNFEGVVQQANVSWNNTLGKIDIETSDNDSRTVFYTSLYHTFIQPSLASDIDGRYRTMGHEIKRDTSYTNYTVFSLWDTFRATHPLYTIITPKQNQAFIRSLLCKYDESGILPKWELASNETGTMIGYHAVSVIADAIMKKQCDFDIKRIDYGLTNKTDSMYDNNNFISDYSYVTVNLNVNKDINDHDVPPDGEISMFQTMWYIGKVDSNGTIQRNSNSGAVGSDVQDKHGNVYFEKGETKTITLYYLITDEEFENETLAIDFYIEGSPCKGTLAIIHEPEAN